nr:iron-containing alcohol dehydrogenase [Victivallales bacterium]
MKSCERNYQLKYPTKIIFACGAISTLPGIIKNEKTLFVIGKSSEKNGLRDRLNKILSGSNFIILCGEVGEEAPLESVDKIVDIGRKENANILIGIGGGSVLDATKAAAGIIPTGGQVADYFHGSSKIKSKGITFIAAPTTAGTGTELTENAVLSDKKTLTKKSIRSEHLIPDVAIIDPELTFLCPPTLATNSGMDALVQAIESLVCPESNNPSRALALKSVCLILDNLQKAVAGDNDAKIAVAEGSMLSAMSFSQTGLGAVHGLAHPVGIKFDIPHG